MPQAKFDPGIYVHSPADLGKMHLDHYQFIQDNPGIQWGVPCLDEMVIPQRPGDLTIICGRPGSGKSSLLARQAKITAREIAARGAQYDECVIYVSWEQHAEEIEAYFAADDHYSVSDYAWGRVSIEEVQRKAIRRAGLPLWVIGHSSAHVVRQTQPLTLSLVFKAIESMAHTYKKAPRPVLLCFDYAQLIPDERRHQNRYEEVKAAIRSTKHLALRMGCPVMVAAQASRDVDHHSPPIPGMNDAQESSGIEQVCDKFFGIWRPWRTHEHHTSVAITKEVSIPVEIDTFVLKMNKQRMDDGDKTFVLSFNPAELRLAEMEQVEREPVWV